MRKPRAIDLFCGAGGLTQGLREAGFKVIGAVDNDELACRAYKINHSRVKLWRMDIAKLKGPRILRDLKLKRGELDLLAACPPCQGFSTMRTKNGTKRIRDSRNALIRDVLRLVRSIQPKGIMLENVPGLAQSRLFESFCREIRKLGYKVKSAVLNTVDYAVPQRRRRLVLLASKTKEPNFATRADQRPTVRDAIGKLDTPNESKDFLHNYDVQRSDKILELIKGIPRNGGSRKALGVKYQLKCHKGFKGFWDVYGRMAWDKPSPTITGGCINPSKGRFLHPYQHRAITLREAALLQTFPQGYFFPMDKGRYPAALLIGNALPPEFIRRHALALKEAL